MRAVMDGAPASARIDGPDQRLLAALTADGARTSAPAGEDLASLDGLRLGGRAAAARLAGLADVQPHDLVLDLGCGLGGSSRFLARTAGCHVVGLDPTKESCRMADAVSRRIGLATRTCFEQGSPLGTPFADGEYDVVWTEHAQVGVADKRRFYGEAARVLRVGGKLAFHDLFAGERAPQCSPVPWASDGGSRHLVTPQTVRAILGAVGLSVEHWRDETAESIAFLREATHEIRRGRRPPLGLRTPCGDGALSELEDVLRDLEEGRASVVQAVARRTRPLATD